MRKKILLFLFSISVLTLWGQGWKVNMEADLYNPRDFEAYRESRIIIEYSVNDGVFERLLDSNIRTASYTWQYREVPTQVYPTTKYVTKFQVYTKLERNNGGDPQNGWRPALALQNKSEKVKYKKITFHYDQVYYAWQGSLKAYISPTGLAINYNSAQHSIPNVLPSTEKVKIEATSGFDPEVYQWVYSNDLSKDISLWTPIANSSLQGSHILEASGKDIYGTDFLNKMDASVNTYIALRYYVYKDRANSQIYEGTNKIVLTNMKSAPHIIDCKPISPQCYGEADGAIKITLNRALSSNESLEIYYDELNPLKLNTIDGENSFIIPGLAVGTRTVQIAGYHNNYPMYSDGENHKKEVTITAPSQVNFDVASGGVTHVLCYGNFTGSIIVNASGGTPPYKLNWKRKNGVFYPTGSFDTSVKLESLNADEYELYVTDKNNCYAKNADGSPATQKVMIQQPAAGIEINTFSTKSPSGYGLSNGSISVEIEGGQPGSGGWYSSCLWVNKLAGSSVTAFNEVINGKFRSTIENIPAGVYTVVVKDQSGCDRSADINLSEPAQFTASLSVSKAITCNGDSDGALLVSAQGGVGGVSSYKWYKKENGSFISISGYSQTISQLAAGEYRVELEDSSSPVNKTAVNYQLNGPAIVELDNYQIQDVTCFGESNGRITITAKGGNGGYKLKYKNKDSVAYKDISAVGGSPTIIVPNLPQGEYLFQLYDRNNCMASFADGDLKLTIKQPEEPLTVHPYGMTNISGYGRSDGALSFRVEGGTPNTVSPEYSVVWRNSLNNLLPHIEKTENGVFITEITGIPQGKYTLEVLDNNYQSVKNGCYAVAVGVLTEPDPLTVDLVNPVTVNCHGDSSGVLVAEVRGGIPFSNQDELYIFKWYQVVNGIDSLLVLYTDSVLSNAGAGHYKVFIEDSSIPANTVESAVFEITQPPLLVTQLSTKNISCFGSNDGFIHIEVAGGVGNYHMFYRHMETDTAYHELAVNTSDNTFYLDSLFSGVYSVYITDGNNCYADIEGEQICEITLTQPAEPLQISDVATRNQSGYGITNGSIRIQIEGGTPQSDNSYTVSWKDGHGNTIQDKTSFSNGKYISLIDNLKKGDYIVVVTDDNYASAYPGKGANCFLTDTFTITEPAEFVVKLEESHFVTCNGMEDGQLTASVRGGVINPDLTAMPYRYIWYKEVNGTYETLDNSGVELRYLTAGNYRLTVEDYSWITNRVTIDYELKQPDKLIISADDVSVMCGQLATVQAVITGGTPPYKYEWNTGDTTSVINDAVSGKYMLFVTDSRGCEASAIVRVSAPSDLNVTGETHDPLCLGSSNGSIELTVTGGQAPYTYKWSTGATTPVLRNVPAGAYTVIVSDLSGCSFFQSFVLNNPEAISVYIGEDRVLCAGQQHEIIPVYEDPNSTCYWTGPSGFTSKDKQIRVKQPGTYKLTITDSNGCQATDELVITTENLTISSEFVVSSQVFAGDTIVLVNISNPYPERTEWVIPESDSLDIVEKTDELARVIFKETGYYAVGLRTYVGDCYEENLKSISVAAAENKDYVLRESGIKSFIVSPNPNNGVFNVLVELNRVYNIRIRIISIGSGVILSDQKYYGSDIYSLPYNLALASGAYVVLLETEAGQMTVKMIIK